MNQPKIKHNTHFLPSACKQKKKKKHTAGGVWSGNIRDRDERSGEVVKCSLNMARVVVGWQREGEEKEDLVKCLFRF